MTRDEWLKTLDWRDDPLPDIAGFPRTGIVIETLWGMTELVGDVNIFGSHERHCDRGPRHVARWAPLYEEE